MNSRKGIKRILLAPAGRMSLPLPWAANSGNAPLLPWAGGLICVGSRKPTKLVIKPIDEIKDYRGRLLRNKMDFSLDVDSYQLRMRDLDWLFLFVQNKYDIQIQRERQNSYLYSGGVFNWFNQQNGLGFQYTMTNKERFCKVKFQTAMEYDLAKALIDAADDPSVVIPTISVDSQSGANERGENLALYAYPWYFSIEAPDGTEIFSKKEIIERSFKFSSKGVKNEYNEDVVDSINVELKIKGSDATIDKIKAILAKDMAPSLTVKEYLSSTTYEKFVFLPNTLTHSDDFELGDDSDFSQLTFNADVALDQVKWEYGVANGGVGSSSSVEALGTTELEARKGGTFTFGDEPEEEE